MQSNVFLAMLKTQYEVASFSQIADTCEYGAQKSNNKLAGVRPMQSNVFLAMLKTQYQVATLIQIASTCDSGAQK
jgi:hypothetical protein